MGNSLRKKEPGSLDSVESQRRNIIVTIDKIKPPLTKEQRQSFQQIVDMVLKYGSNAEKLKTLCDLEQFAKMPDFSKFIDACKLFVERTGENVHRGTYAFFDYCVRKSSDKELPVKEEVSIIADIINEMGKECDPVDRARAPIVFSNLFIHHSSGFDLTNLPTLKSIVQESVNNYLLGSLYLSSAISERFGPSSFNKLKIPMLDAYRVLANNDFKAIDRLKPLVRRSDFSISEVENLFLNLKTLALTSPEQLDEALGGAALGVNRLTQTGIVHAKTLVASLEVKDANLETYINFAYALDVLGEGKTKELYKEYGITYFLRYGKKTLEELYQTYKNPVPKGKLPDKPVLLVVFNKNDYNGAFYSEGREIDEFAKVYRVHIFETDSENGFYNSIEKIGRQGGVDVLIIGGHGEESHVLLGTPRNIRSDDHILDLSDEAEIEEHRLSNWMTPRSKLILASCSTGKNEKAIAAMFSRILGVERVFAPREPSSKTFYQLGKDGLIEDVTYEVVTSSEPEGAEFRKGVMGLVPHKTSKKNKPA